MIIQTTIALINPTRINFFFILHFFKKQGAPSHPARLCGPDDKNNPESVRYRTYPRLPVLFVPASRKTYFYSHGVKTVEIIIPLICLFENFV